MPARLAWNRYGKSRVRLVRVVRTSPRHEVREVDVDVQLEGDFETAHTKGDNSRIVATDTMKNTVYALAKDAPVGEPEAFAVRLAEHFVAKYPAVRLARVALRERPWARIDVGGQPHAHAFVAGGGERRIALAMASRGNPSSVESGLDGLVLMKTTGSAFEGFPRCEFTTLREAKDRIFRTAVRAEWTSTRPPSSWDASHASVRRALLETFATHDSRSVQHTLFAMGEAALAAAPEVDEIRLSLPNQHCLLVDLSPFGRDNPNEGFVATDEPHGLIEAAVRRG
jgi:urate oxidase